MKEALIDISLANALRAVVDAMELRVPEGNLGFRCPECRQPVKPHKDGMQGPGVSLLPKIRTQPSTIFVFRSEAGDVEEQAHGGADDRCAEAGGGGPEGGRRSPGVRSVQAHHLCLEGEVRGMDVSEAQEAKQLRDENTRLRKPVADLSLDKEALQSVNRKNGWSS